MADVLAIVSKAIFDKQAKVGGKVLELGTVWPVEAYDSRNKRLEKLTPGSSLYLVTIRPPEVPWLVAVLDDPTFDGTRWTATPNQEPARDMTPWLDQLRFDNGKGLSFKPGRLGMSLQTPRVLTAEDAALLRGPATSTAPPGAGNKPTATRPPRPPRQRIDPAKTPGSALLDGALERLRADDTITALDSMLEAWGQCRAVALATTIEALGEVVDRSFDPVGEGLKPKAFEELWLDIAAARRPADITRLMASFGHGSARAMKGFAAQLADFKPDPRIPWPALAAASCYSSTGAGPTRTAAFRLAQTIADPRTAHCPPEDPNLRGNGYITEWVTRLRKKLPEPPTLAAVDLEALAAIEVELGRIADAPAPSEDDLMALRPAAPSNDGRSEEELIKLVLADPQDESARLVYGDWLSERGDPRGEVIVLQHKEQHSGSTAKERKRIKELIKAHGASWIRPLDAVVAKPRFTLGFLSGCGEIRFRTKKQRSELVSHELWSTVREIDACNYRELLTGGALDALTTVRTTADIVAAMSKLPSPPPLETVTAPWCDRGLLDERPGERRWSPWQANALAEHAQTSGVEPWSVVASVGGLQTLKHLRLIAAESYPLREAFRGTPDGLEWLLSSRLAGQLERLELLDEQRALELRGWLDGGLEPFVRLQALELYTSPRYSVGGLSPAGGRTMAGSPCEVRWRLIPNGHKPPTIELDVGWPYFKDRLRDLGAIFAINLAGFPRKTCPELQVRYVGKTGRAFDLERLGDDLETLLVPSFTRVHLPDGRVAKR